MSSLRPASPRAAAWGWPGQGHPLLCRNVPHGGGAQSPLERETRTQGLPEHSPASPPERGVKQRGRRPVLGPWAPWAGRPERTPRDRPVDARLRRAAHRRQVRAVALAGRVPLCLKGGPWAAPHSVRYTFPSWQSGLLDPREAAKGLRFSRVQLACCRPRTAGLPVRGFPAGVSRRCSQQVSTADVPEQGPPPAKAAVGARRGHPHPIRP